MAAQVAQAQLAAERFDLGKVAAQAAQAQLAAERFDLGKVAAQAAQAQLAASSFLARDAGTYTGAIRRAWNERVAASVWRLERTSLTEDIVADAADPKRAVEELAKDAAAVEEAAPPGAKERVNTRLFWLLGPAAFTTCTTRKIYPFGVRHAYEASRFTDHDAFERERGGFADGAAT